MDGAITFKMSTTSHMSENLVRQLEGWNVSLYLSFSSCGFLCMANLGASLYDGKAFPCKCLPILSLHHACYSLIGQSQCGQDLYKSVDMGGLDFGGALK